MVRETVKAGDILVVTDANTGSLPQQLRVELTPAGDGVRRCTAEVRLSLSFLGREGFFDGLGVWDGILMFARCLF